MTPWSERVNKAMRIAATAHAGQIRKADGTPYIAHPFAVAWLLAEHDCDEDIVIAGLLHDVLEDTAGYGSAEIARDFGQGVLGIVQEVSEDKDASMTQTEERRTWEDRKRAYVAHVHVASEDALCVSAADKIHNLESMMFQYRVLGAALWDKFNCPEDKKMWFYEEVLRAIGERTNHALAVRLGETLARSKRVFGLE
jgi:(p)ppGpp synthase/HD superfamily hydrolase